MTNSTEDIFQRWKESIVTLFNHMLSNPGDLLHFRNSTIEAPSLFQSHCFKDLLFFFVLIAFGGMSIAFSPFFLLLFISYFLLSPFWKCLDPCRKIIDKIIKLQPIYYYWYLKVISLYKDRWCLHQQWQLLIKSQKYYIMAYRYELLKTTLHISST